MVDDPVNSEADVVASECDDSSTSSSCSEVSSEMELLDECEEVDSIKLMQMSKWVNQVF